MVPKIKAPNEALPADIPISAEVLHLIATHPLFANAPPVSERFHDATWAESRDNWTTVYGRKTTTHWLRPGLIKADKITQETTIQSGKRYPGTRRETEISAANGFLVLGSKGSFSGSGFSGTDSEKLLRIYSMKGHIFPVEVGNRFSYEAAYHQEINGERTNNLSCEVTKKFDAKTLHAKLAGAAYAQVCTTQVRYPRKGINNSASFTSYFLEALGTWIDTGERFTLKSFETTP
jgi:hypothetical protein